MPDKMKKMRVGFRQFQRKRLNEKLKKMVKFCGVTAKKGEGNPFEAYIEIIQGHGITISYVVLNEVLCRYTIYEIDIEAYDEDINLHSVALLLTPPQENFVLHLATPEQKVNFIIALRAFMQLTEELETSPSTDSGRSTLS